MADRQQQADDLAAFLSNIPGINVAESMARWAEFREAEAEYHAKRGDHRQAARHREFGIAARRHLARYRAPRTAPIVNVRPPVCSRPRERRERHIARSTSSTSSGDSSSGEPGEPDLARPSRAVARCPLCGGEAMARARCWLCGGLGQVDRELRNAYKRGWRP